MFRGLIAVLLTVCSIFIVQADDRIMADKTAIQAAFLYNFALYTEWPSIPDNAFNICVMADEQMLEALVPVKNKRIKDHPISVIRIDSSRQAKNCQVLFVGIVGHPSLKELAEQIRSTPVLVVTEEESAELLDASIVLSEQQNKIKFKINRTEAAKRSMSFSSKLLNLATQVY